MAEERNNYQIARKDAKNCFVESLNDSFPIGRVHFAFATYDVNRPVGQRQTGWQKSFPCGPTGTRKQGRFPFHCEQRSR